ncbi:MULTISPECIES: hypothetical protein [Bradyrhizobium]|uniref:hypothetical protein n=1 Tax=Bradyrhizobium TaxID=374 RepID=UPI0004816A2F|nr:MULTISPECIES: hypothetical protein [Bradyrhizobium]WLB90673.1 hypothetical protein QIH91_09555 [Bradyrhizobium japonicum USDA 135]GLR93910.1 hypothetical protein GCM10007858_15380 [Bradyrhizobium liaoningense]
MQKSAQDLPQSDRPVLRKWRLAVVSFYGSLLAVMLMLALTISHDVQIAGTSVPLASLKK